VEQDLKEISALKKKIESCGLKKNSKMKIISPAHNTIDKKESSRDARCSSRAQATKTIVCRWYFPCYLCTQVFLMYGTG
jgi:hypothetical protein